MQSSLRQKMETIYEALEAAFDAACAANNDQDLIDQLDQAVTLMDELRVEVQEE